MTGVNQKLTPTIELFVDHPGINLKALYGPEHGIRGDAKEGEGVQSSIDPYTNLPVYSLYGKTRKPTEEMLESIDVIVFDSAGYWFQILYIHLYNGICNGSLWRARKTICRFGSTKSNFWRPNGRKFVEEDVDPLLDCYQFQIDMG